jgi:transposase
LALSFFAEPPWDTESPAWLALDRELDPDHPVRRFARLTDEELNLDALRSTYAGRGSLPHRPDLLLKLLIYEHSLGRVQPVQWFQDVKENKAVQWLIYGTRPSQTTLYEFRDRAQPLLKELNQQVIRTAIDEGHTSGSCGALDGTFVAANASRHRLLKLETVEERLEQLEQEIAKAEAATETPPAEAAHDPQPAPMAQDTTPAATAEDKPPSPASAGAETEPPSFLGKTPRGRKRQRDQYRRAQEILRDRHKANARRRKDKRKKGEQIRVAMGDPVAPFGLDKLKTYRPLYNVQTMSDVETDFVLAYAVVPTISDSGQLVPMIELTNETTGRRLEGVLVDSGYPSGKDLARCVELEVVIYAPWNENSFTDAKRAQCRAEEQIPKDQFTFDPRLPGYRCPQGNVLSFRNRTSKQKANGEYVPLEIYQADPSDCARCPLRSKCVRGGSGARTVRRQEHEDLIEALKERMKTPEAKQKYRDRGCTVERRFADLKTHRGLQRFSGRTPERADAQVGLTVLAHNLRILDKLRKRTTEEHENPRKIAS